MSAESLTIIGTGVALAALIFTMLRALRADVTTKQFDEVRQSIRTLDDRVRNHGERMAKLEGLLEGLREAVNGTSFRNAFRGSTRPLRHERRQAGTPHPERQRRSGTRSGRLAAVRPVDDQAPGSTTAATTGQSERGARPRTGPYRAKTRADSDNTHQAVRTRRLSTPPQPPRLSVQPATATGQSERGARCSSVRPDGSQALDLPFSR